MPQPRPHRPGWFSRVLVPAACLAWGLTLAGCNHPMAQRPHGEWASQRVLVDNAADADARVKPASREGFYTLVREWDESEDVSPDAPAPGEVQQVYLDRGELLGFRWSTEADGVVEAVDGSRSIQVTLYDGVHYVWYRENDDAEIVAQDLLLIVLGAALIVGIVALAANGDGTVEVDF